MRARSVGMPNVSVYPSRPDASAARAAAMAVAGAGAAGCPTSMWMTRPPAASMRAAAAITSITMNAGTSLRADGVITRLAASTIVFRPLMSRADSAPLSPHFCGQIGHRGPAIRRDRTALTVLGRTTSLRGKMVRSQADMIGTQRPIRARRTTPAARLVAMVTATALICASVPAQAQSKGPPVIRDAETEQLLREYTQPILRRAGLAQQNVQVVIINDRSFNAFVADGRVERAVVDDDDLNILLGEARATQDRLRVFP